MGERRVHRLSHPSRTRTCATKTNSCHSSLTTMKKTSFLFSIASGVNSGQTASTKVLELTDSVSVELEELDQERKRCNL